MFLLPTKLRLSDYSTMRWTAASISSIQRGRMVKAKRSSVALCTIAVKNIVLASKVLSRRGQKMQSDEMRALTVASVEESFRLLQTDSIDLMMIHCGATEMLPR